MESQIQVNKDLRNGMRHNYGTGDVPRTILQFRHNNVKPTTFGWQGDDCSEDFESLQKLKTKRFRGKVWCNM